jgi:hypothetical protein
MSRRPESTPPSSWMPRPATNLTLMRQRGRRRDMRDMREQRCGRAERERTRGRNAEQLDAEAGHEPALLVVAVEAVCDLGFGRAVASEIEATECVSDFRAKWASGWCEATVRARVSGWCEATVRARVRRWCKATVRARVRRWCEATVRARVGRWCEATVRARVSRRCEATVRASPEGRRSSRTRRRPPAGPARGGGRRAAPRRLQHRHAAPHPAPYHSLNMACCAV